ncbi:proline iminopeptidase [Punctularia strigosozonata HHB-11173 SS5]|uniref:proline iminopeptidase n=1 Tax=Punctularia strigosozonata (strain HHB-11173) TaxID=741275 RepID=UPI0004416302|nr:proline iminopeptidase [Punctularia strigosozonata HHB-11173 SS5]EIN10808.1 proline iminopeptidase [Punctularia strigosozonata HHB-11173 SS5]
MSSVKEGEAPFSIPGIDKPTKTWYKVVGDLSSSASGRPLVCLHGGPGAPHNYLLAIADVATAHAIPVVFYDQIGNGNSTHIPEKNGDEAFWSTQLFLDELDNLVKHLGIADAYDVLGQSWGGMLGAMHAITQPKGLHRLIISNSPASMKMWVVAANKLRLELPQDVQDALTKHETDGTTDSKEYQDAMDVFYAKHVIRINPMPQDVKDAFDWIAKDPTVYHTMNGPSEFHIIGSLRDWSILDQIHSISVPTLLINGRYDEATDEVVQPFFDSIPKVKWVTFSESSHMPQWEERERYMEVVASFLKS